MNTLHRFIYKQEEAVFLGERYPQQEMIVESRCDDLNAHEILSLFKSYMVATGYAEKSFYDACAQATEENPYCESRNGHEMGENDDNFYERLKSNYEEAQKEYDDNFQTDNKRIAL